MTANLIRHTLFDTATGYHGDGDCWSVSDFIEILQKALDEVPEDYRADAKIEIETEGDYDGPSYGTLNVYYDAPETAEEEAARLLADSERRAKSAAYSRNQELNTLAFLKAKYEA